MFRSVSDRTEDPENRLYCQLRREEAFKNKKGARNWTEEFEQGRQRPN